MCLEQRREAVTFGKMPFLCSASMLGAAARLIPFCSGTRLQCAGGLEKSHVQCSHWTELGGEQSKLPFLQHHPSIQLYRAYTGIQAQHSPWTPNTRTASITLQELSPASSTLVRHLAGRSAEREPA